MKFARYRHEELEGWGIVDTNVQTLLPIVGSIAQWAPAITKGTGRPETAGAPIPLSSVRLLAPIEPTTTIFGVGLNYWTHLEKLGKTEPPETTQGFVKPRAAIVGPDDELKYPPLTTQLDYEIELVAVVGSVEVNDAERPATALLGYTVGNDISARDTPSPLGGYDLYSMKGLDRSTPLGPWIVTPDEVGGTGPLDIEIICRVNGEVRQRDRTKKMIWDMDWCVDYVRARTSLAVGDVIFTGTTDGVAAEDGRWLQPGDVVESEIENIGTLHNVVGPRRAAPTLGNKR